MSGLKFRPIWKFIFSLNSSEEERYHNGIDIDHLFYDAKQYIRVKLGNNIFDEDLKEKSQADLRYLEKALVNLKVSKVKERFLVLDLIVFIKSFYDDAENEIIKRGNVFKSFYGESFFIESLIELNVISAEGKTKRGFQAASNAIFKSSKLQENIFKPGVQLKEYIFYLNERFDAQINTSSKLSDGTNYDLRVENYFNNFYRNEKI